MALIAGIQMNAQTITAEKFYKDIELYKEVEAKKGNYRQVFSDLEDGTKKVEVIEIKSGIAVDIKYYRNGKPTGIWEVRNKSGKIASSQNFDKLVYSDAKIEGGLYFDYQSDAENHEKQDLIPAHFGSDEDRIRFLSNNARYPQEAREKGIQGTVILHIRITKMGEVQVVSISKSVDPFLDFEALRVYESMPAWTPAFLNGEPVDSYTFIPLKFTLAY